jgi:phosphoribosylaminoimidazole-succinocarboxamide synthase
MPSTTLAELRPVYQGKVRDVYDFGADKLLLVATDRVSAFDWVLPTEIPDKGKVLTQLSIWWFNRLADLVPNHFLDEAVPSDVLGRAMVVKKLQMLPVEAVVRGFLTGSGLVDYQRTGSVGGHALPEGLKDGDRLAQPIFTPATKAPKGEHDVTIDLTEVASKIGVARADKLSQLSLKLYQRANEICEEVGFVIADTKFEFGTDPTLHGDLVLADEAFTPDSSRYWSLAQTKSAGRPEPFDKQLVRDWLLSPASGWSKDSNVAPPPLPDEIVEKTRERYLTVYRRVTGEALQ